MRQFEVYRNNIWIPCDITDLKDGDRFRIFDNGERFINHITKEDEWIAFGEAFLNEDGIMAIKCR